MGRVITGRGLTLDEIRAKKGVALGANTFDSNFGSSDWRTRFPQRGYPWLVNQAPSEQTVINEEQQYYLQSADIAAGVADPASVNAQGQLELRCVRTPASYQDKALGVVQSYTVTDVLSNNQFKVRGRGYYDRNLSAALSPNPPGGDTRILDLASGVGKTFAGVERYLRDNVNGDAPGTSPASSDFHKPSYPYGFLKLASGQRVKYTSISSERTQYTPNDKNDNAPDVKSTITLQAGEQMPAVGQMVTLLRRMPYVSGMLSTRGYHQQKFGSWHMRVKLPGGKGTFAAAWSWPSYPDSAEDNKQKSVEIDFVEQLGHTDIQYHNAHQPEFDMKDYVARNGKTPIFTDKNSASSPLPSASDSTVRSGLRGKLEGDITASTLKGPEWDAQNIQQHQVRLDSGQLDFTNAWQEVIWDWYPDNTCAWFVKTGGTFREIAHSHMSPLAADGTFDERVIFLNNAFDGSFNRNQEFYDRNRMPFRPRVAPPYVFSVEFIRAYGWTGGSTGGTGNTGAVTLTVNNTGPVASGTTTGVAQGRQVLLTPQGGTSVPATVNADGSWAINLAGKPGFVNGASITAYTNNPAGQEASRTFSYTATGGGSSTGVTITVANNGPIVSGSTTGVAQGRQVLLTPSGAATVTATVDASGNWSADVRGKPGFANGAIVTAYTNNPAGQEASKTFAYDAGATTGVSIAVSSNGPIVSGSTTGVAQGRQVLLTPAGAATVTATVAANGTWSADVRGRPGFTNGANVTAYTNNPAGQEASRTFAYTA